MIKLVLQFYIPALLITLVIAAFFSLIYALIFFTGRRSQQSGRAALFVHELAILNLLTIPVASFSILAILVVLRAMKV